MKLKHSLGFSGLALCTLLTGCWGSATHYYSLKPTCPAPPAADFLSTQAAATASAPSTIEVFLPTVSQSLDKDRIVYQIRDYKVIQASGKAWSDPISSMIGRTFTRDMQCILPNSEVYMQNDNVADKPHTTIGLTITDFSLDSQGYTAITGMVAINVPGKKQVLKPIAWRSSHTVGSVMAEIEDLSEGLSVISSNVASDLTTG